MTTRLTGRNARARIIAATVELIEELGVAGASVTRVMEMAGVSRTAFYRHFSDLYEVMALVLQQVGAEILEQSGAWLNDPNSIGSPDVVYPNLLHYAEAYAPHGRLLAALSDAAAADPRVRLLWRDGVVQAYMDATTAAIERDQAVGAIRADLDARAASYALTMMGERASYDLLGRHPRGEPADYARMLAPVWIGTLFGRVAVVATANLESTQT